MDFDFDFDFDFEQLGASIMFIAWSITSRRSPKPFPKDLRAKLEHVIANATIGKPTCVCMC